MKCLMNVAVSHAKGRFFVFGDRGCLNDGKNSPSDLLKESVTNIE